MGCQDSSVCEVGDRCRIQLPTANRSFRKPVARLNDANMYPTFIWRLTYSAFLKPCCRFITFKLKELDRFSIKFFILVDIQAKYTYAIFAYLFAYEIEQQGCLSLSEQVVSVGTAANVIHVAALNVVDDISHSWPCESVGGIIQNFPFKRGYVMRENNLIVSLVEY
ncbi:hypothetical protein CLF_110875 [Clonorchis sinensis]|uniref:Uncharacterized protein n=1 Tax=Clonorchis sinensis TaxID=79923 RepID=G7YL84_CLOSI|nr:hypothetical protein CLF_110875 [Clonorchis sinensis]